MKVAHLLLLGLTFVSAADSATAALTATANTPIKYLVVIFQENVSFDHYFATYPRALNPPAEPRFDPASDTPTVNGLTDELIRENQNMARPFRLDRSQSKTCDNDDHYRKEQAAYNGGLLNRFVEYTSAREPGCMPNLAMGYYDGNTVTALWNYAAHFAMSDNFFTATFGSTVMGHINLISGNTHGAIPSDVKYAGTALDIGWEAGTISHVVYNGSIVDDVGPAGDDCEHGTSIRMTGRNIGDLMNKGNVTWGWFYSNFRRFGEKGGKAICSRYDGHYEPFQYYPATANPHHLPPMSLEMIGKSDRANHQYDLRDFWQAAASGNLPQVSFLEAPASQNGHPKTSGPLAEQKFIVEAISSLEKLPQWPEMAIIITYDDSDGWYDHVMPPIVNQSDDWHYDTLLGRSGRCGKPGKGAYLDRCGYGPRVPFLVISPYARVNFVSHTLADQASVSRFIEDNWNLGRIGNQSLDAKAGSILSLFDFRAPHAKPLFLNDETGEPLASPSAANLR